MDDQLRKAHEDAKKDIELIASEIEIDIDTLEEVEGPTDSISAEPPAQNEVTISNEVKTQVFEFDVTETKELVRDGQTYGMVAGYASTFNNVDRGRDRVMAGAFKSTIERHKARNRPVRMYYQHDNKEIIGGFPASKMREDAKGLYVEGEINLSVQRGREVFALAKQGVLTDFSIGYSIADFDFTDGVRELKEVELWEVSVVSEPMNTEATITDIKESLNTKRDVERKLRDLGLSRSQATLFASLVDESKLHKDDADGSDEVSLTKEEIVTVEENSMVNETQLKTNDLLRQASELMKQLKGQNNG